MPKDSDSLLYRCPHCRETVAVDDSLMGEKIDCSRCGKPFVAEAPVARPIGFADDAQDLPSAPPRGASREAPEVVRPSDDEKKITVIHPTIFRRHILGTIVSYLFVFGGIAAVTIGILTGALVPPGLIFVIAGAAVFLIGVFYLLKWFIVSRTTSITLTNERIVYREGFIRQSTSEVRHDDIRNIRVDQNFKERILRFGDIAISTAGQSDMEIVINDIPNPEQVAEFIRSRQ